jgi:transcription elongation factor Elf1
MIHVVKDNSKFHASFTCQHCNSELETNDVADLKPESKSITLDKEIILWFQYNCPACGKQSVRPANTFSFVNEHLLYESVKLLEYESKRLEPYTFGKEPCYVKLAELLSELNDEKVTQKVGKLISDYRTKLKDLNVSSLGKGNRSYFSSTLEKDYREKVSEQSDFGETLKSHLLLCIKTGYRQFLDSLQNTPF